MISLKCTHVNVFCPVRPVHVSYHASRADGIQDNKNLQKIEAKQQKIKVNKKESESNLEENES